MRRVSTISVSLEPRYIEALNRLAKKVGSKSAAIRVLLDRQQQIERRSSLETQYRDYFANPAAVRAEKELTEELLSASSWLKPARRRKGRGRAARNRPAR